MTEFTCTKCGVTKDEPLAIFPGGVCIDCFVGKHVTENPHLASAAGRRSDEDQFLAEHVVVIPVTGP